MTEDTLVQNMITHLFQNGVSRLFSSKTLYPAISHNNDNNAVILEYNI